MKTNMRCISIHLLLTILCLPLAGGCREQTATSSADLDIQAASAQMQVSRAEFQASLPIENGIEILKGQFQVIHSIKLNPARTVVTIIGEPQLGQPGQQTFVLDLSNRNKELARFGESYRLTCVSPNDKRIAVVHSFEVSRPMDSTSLIANSRGDAVPTRSEFESNDLRVFDFTSGTWLFTANKSNRRIHAVAYSEDGERVLTIQESEDTISRQNDNGQIGIEFGWWDAETGESVRTVSGPAISLLPSDQARAGIVVCAGATKVAIWNPGSSIGELVICDTTTGEVVQRLKQKGEFSVAAFNSEGSRLATVGHAEGIATGTTENGFRANTELKVWDLSSGTALTTKSFGTTSAIEFSPDSRHIILNEVDFTDPDVQSDLVVIDAVTANEVLRMRRIGYSPKFGFLANDTIFATVLSRNIDGVQMHVLGKLFSWQLPDAMRDLPSEMHKTKGEM